MYGFGKEERHLRELIKELELEEHVFLNDLTNEYHDSYMNLITSNMEGFSLALSHGVPTISYDIKYGPGELIENGVNGYLVEKNNEEELYEKVKHLLNHPGIRSDFSNNCYVTVETYFKQNVIKKWEYFLKSIK